MEFTLVQECIHYYLDACGRSHRHLPVPLLKSIVWSAGGVIVEYDLHRVVRITRKGTDHAYGVVEAIKTDEPLATLRTDLVLVAVTYATLHADWPRDAGIVYIDPNSGTDFIVKNGVIEKACLGM
ncbi:MAG: hypothetical protein WC802_00590 [Patescibacteria group bacterium]|jgi:hypothetical protein